MAPFGQRPRAARAGRSGLVDHDICTFTYTAQPQFPWRTYDDSAAEVVRMYMKYTADAGT